MAEEPGVDSSSAQVFSRDSAAQQRHVGDSPPGTSHANGGAEAREPVPANGHVSESEPSDKAAAEGGHVVEAVTKVGKTNLKRKAGAGAGGGAPVTPGKTAAASPGRKRKSVAAQVPTHPSEGGSHVGTEGIVHPPSVATADDDDASLAGVAEQESRVETPKEVKGGKKAGGKGTSGKVKGVSKSEKKAPALASSVRESTRSQKSRTL